MLITFIASILIWLLFAGLIILWVIDGNIKKEQVLHALYSSGLAWLIGFFIKIFFPTLRPFVENGDGVKTLTIPGDGAFPSQHTAIAFAVAITIFMHDKKYGWLFLIAAIIIGAGRVMANVHYPLDILGGALLGTLTAVVVEKRHLFNFLRRKGR